MPRMSMVEAIRDALDVMMARDESVVVFGEDVGYFGGVFRCTHGLQQKYGTSRCFDAPVSESGIVGTAVGMAAYGLRPCVEIQFADYVYPAYDQIVSEAARLRYRSNGEFTCGRPVATQCQKASGRWRHRDACGWNCSSRWRIHDSGGVSTWPSAEITVYLRPMLRPPKSNREVSRTGSAGARGGRCTRFASTSIAIRRSRADLGGPDQPIDQEPP